MRGSNHIATGVATAVVLADSYFLIQSAPDYTVPKLMVTDIVQTLTDTILPLWVYIPLGIFLYLLGLLLPDIDCEYSTLGKKFYLPIGHRTWLHSIWFVLIFGIASIWIRVFFFLSFGIFTHLFFDSFSRSGVKWFYPLRNRHHKLKLYRTSNVSEYICMGIVVALAVIYSVFTIQHIYHIFPI